MSRFYSYLNSATTIIENYRGETPLAIYIKKFFNSSKKFGSKDRKQISALVYNYYRVGLAINSESVEEKLLIATFLCENKSSQVLENIKPEWNELVENKIEDKINVIGKLFEKNKIFPLTDQLSQSVEVSTFKNSFYNQPNLYLRIRPGHKINVMGKLQANEIKYELVSENTLSFANSTKTDEILKVGEEVIVQDFSSQQVGNMIAPYIKSKQVSVWDCCAASGGKSIMMYDLNNIIQLTVSDVRQSILDNLEERFKAANITRYSNILADLTEPETFDELENFDVILADVPCSGSGTWARTPEQLYFFDKKKISYYTDLQYNIASNVLAKLKNGGVFIYITCSVFANENEGQVLKLSKNHSLEIISQQIIRGYENKADSMFVAVMSKKQ
jgi:16S rRNA (cytosine967-C5)-methyltransferase